ncbi:hypoxanthine-guanine phosphoribosyltransferase-like [Styela clava]
MGDERGCIVVEDDFPGYSPKYFNIPRHYESDVEYVLLPRGLVIDRTERMAKDIFYEMDFSKPLLAMCVLKGGYIFFNDLLHQLRQLSAQSNNSCQMGIDFIRLKSYQNDQSSGEVKVIGGDDLKKVEGKNLLIVEDIIDTGRTMEKLLEMLKPHKPNSIKVASMLIKRTERSSGYRPDHIGFEVPDKFVIGYGLDYNEYFRDMGHICVISESGKKKYSA